MNDKFTHKFLKFMTKSGTYLYNFTLDLSLFCHILDLFLDLFTF